MPKRRVYEVLEPEIISAEQMIAFDAQITQAEADLKENLS